MFELKSWIVSHAELCECVVKLRELFKTGRCLATQPSSCLLHGCAYAEGSKFIALANDMLQDNKGAT